MVEAIEYKPIRALNFDEKVFIRIPTDIILDEDIGDMRISVYSFFAVRHGIDMLLNFSVNDVYEWTGRDLNNKNSNAYSDIKNTILRLVEKGYLSVDNEFKTAKNAKRINARFEIEKVDGECAEYRFAIMYVDELKKLLSYTDDEHGYLNRDAMMLILSYLRMEIPRRSNKLRADEIGAGAQVGQSDVDVRRNKYPEVYNDHYKSISYEIGLSERLVSKYAEILSDTGIIYAETLPRFQVSGKWHTNWILFCNRYKRDKSSLLAEGEGYFEKEIKAKKNLLLNYKRMAKAKRKQQ